MRRLRRFLLIFVVLLVAGELATRVWDGLQGGTGSLYDFIVAGEPGRPFKLRPGGAVTVPERYGNIRYRFNRDGYRDDDPAPLAGSRRIVLLGDSVSFGLGVQQDRIYAALLERRLREELPGPWEVINLAIFAYNTADELEALKNDGLKHRPELVLLQFYMNDFSIPAAAGGAPPPLSLGQRLTALKNRLLFQSAFYRRLHQGGTALSFHLLHDLRRSRFPETLNANEPRHKLEYLKTTADDQVAAFQKLREIHRLTRENGSRLLVVLSPDEVQLFDRRYDGINARFRAFCRKEGIDLFDPLPALRADPHPVRLFNDGVHYSPEGHALLARLLFEELRRRGLPG